MMLISLTKDIKHNNLLGFVCVFFFSILIFIILQGISYGPSLSFHKVSSLYLF